MAQKLIALKIPTLSPLFWKPKVKIPQRMPNILLKSSNRRGTITFYIVTSGAHMRRSLALFEAQGLQVTAAATDHQVPKYKNPIIPRMAAHPLPSISLQSSHP